MKPLHLIALSILICAIILIAEVSAPSSNAQIFSQTARRLTPTRAEVIVRQPSKSSSRESRRNDQAA